MAAARIMATPEGPPFVSRPYVSIAHYHHALAERDARRESLLSRGSGERVAECHCGRGARGDE